MKNKKILKLMEKLNVWATKENIGIDKKVKSQINGIIIGLWVNEEDVAIRKLAHNVSKSTNRYFKGKLRYAEYHKMLTALYDTFASKYIPEPEKLEN